MDIMDERCYSCARYSKKFTDCHNLRAIKNIECPCFDCLVITTCGIACQDFCNFNDKLRGWIEGTSWKLLLDVRKLK